MHYSGKYNEAELTLLAHDAIAYLKEQLVDDTGILISGIRNDGTKQTDQIIDDFGDVAPFLSQFGGEDMCTAHLELLDTNPEVADFDQLFSHSDFLLGLVWYAQLHPDRETLQHMAVAYADRVYDRWFTAVQSSSFLYSGRVRAPLVIGHDAIFIEVWTELYRLTRDQKWLERAKQLAEFWIGIQQQYNGLLPKYYLTYPKRLRGGLQLLLDHSPYQGVRVLKDNSNYAYALLDLYRLTQREVYKEQYLALQTALTEAIETDTLTNVLADSGGSDLLASFAMIDVCCDAYQLFEVPESLRLARILAEYWLQRQSDTTHLFGKTATASESYFDSETDMCVALFKLAECVPDDTVYATAASNVLDGIIKHHLQQSYPVSVSISDGTVVLPAVKTKFVALATKPILIALAKNQIYEDDTLFMLLKDR